MHPRRWGFGDRAGVNPRGCTDTGVRAGKRFLRSASLALLGADIDPLTR